MDRSDMMHRMYDIKGPLVAKKFAARGFEAVYCPTKEEALKQAISYIPETDVVSWGGSVSINEIGLRPYVLEHNPVIDRDSAKTPEERVELMRKALLCDTFLMGPTQPSRTASSSTSMATATASPPFATGRNRSSPSSV